MIHIAQLLIKSINYLSLTFNIFLIITQYFLSYFELQKAGEYLVFENRELDTRVKYNTICFYFQWGIYKYILN